MDSEKKFYSMFTARCQKYKLDENRSEANIYKIEKHKFLFRWCARVKEKGI
jgi:hypothetical protein